MTFILRFPSSFRFYSASTSKKCVLLAKKYVNFNTGSVCFMSSQKDFEEAKSRLNSFSIDPGNETKLKIYGLFKQATEGTVATKRPGITDFVGRAKWDAWKAVGDISTEEAQKTYINLVNSLAKNDKPKNESQQAADQKYNNILVDFEGGLQKITLNRPKKMNAMTLEMDSELISALQDAAEDPQTVLTAITGAGSFYCSGKDLSNFANVSPDKLPELADNSIDVTNRLVGAFIDFPKPLVAVINGPAVGISVTILGLFDGVYASDKATFHTPFSSLGITAEGCSSFTFPRLMGYANAAELLFLNKKITAAEALRLCLVTEIFPDASLHSEIWPRLEALAKLPAKSLLYSKELMRSLDKETLHKINDMECKRLRERCLSEDCIDAAISFFSRSK